MGVKEARLTKRGRIYKYAWDLFNNVKRI